MVNEDEAKALIREWGRRHDEHFGLAGFMDMLAEDGLVLKFGENQWHGYAGFEAHQRLKDKFFDEAHVYDESAWVIEVGAEETIVHSGMRWECRTRDEHAPRSQHLAADLKHAWRLIRCPRRGTPVILFHECLELAWLPGQGPEGEHPGNVHLNAGRP